MTRGGNPVSYTANIGFLVIVGIGAVIVACRGGEEKVEADPPKVVATRSMPVNHQLQPPDLEVDGLDGPKAGADKSGSLPPEAARAMSELTGRYLVKAIAQGKPVSKASVADRPRLSLEGGAIVIGLPVSRKDVNAGTITAGTETLACSGRKSVGERSFVVEAILCPARGDDCVGFVRLSPPERQDGSLFGPGLAPRLGAAACEAAGG